MKHPSHLLHAFLKPLNTDSNSPFSKLLKFMRCIDRLPNELAQLDSEIFGNVCVPLYTKSHRENRTQAQKNSNATKHKTNATKQQHKHNRKKTATQQNKQTLPRATHRAENAK